MNEDMMIEQPGDTIKRQVFERYLSLSNDLAYASTILIQPKRKIQTVYLNFLCASLKPKIIELVSLSRFNPKFYNQIKKHYEIYFDSTTFATTKKKAKFNTETMIEFWEEIKEALLQHQLIELKGD